MMSEPNREGTYKLEGHILYKSGFNLAWLEELNINPDTIVDVGSYDFGDTIRFKIGVPHASVFGFELDYDNYIKYEDLALRYHVIPANIGISNENKVDKFYKANNKSISNCQGCLSEPKDEYYKKYSYVSHEHSVRSVIIRRLDYYFKEIDMLHIDVEGGEYQVLLGLGNVRPKIISLEYLIDGGWVGQSFQSVNKWFMDNKYKLVIDGWPDKVFIHETI